MIHTEETKHASIYELDQSEKNGRQSKSWWKFWKQRRYVIACLSFFGFFICYALRVNLSIAIIAMTELKTTIMENGTIVQERGFEWDSVIQGYVLSSFFYGYMTTQLLGGVLGTAFGGKYVFGIGIGGTAFWTLLTPLAAKLDVNFLIALRIVIGIFEGASYPAMHTVWAKWAPPSEASRLVTVAFSGSYFGAVISMAVSSLLATSLGWESIFYLSGTAGVIWFFLWMIIVADSPETDSRISASELNYIKESLSKTEKRVTLKDVSWGALLTSLPVWSIAVTNFAETWGLYTLMTELPKYMKGALGFDLNATGIISALPYLAVAITTPLFGQLADWLILKKTLTVVQVRKLCIIVGFTGQIIFLTLAAFFASPLKSTICFTLAVACGGAIMTGFSVNVLDIARKYAGILFGFTNTMGCISGILSPIIVGYIVRDESDINQWRVIFYIADGIFIVCTLFFVCFASDKPEPWSIETEIPIDGSRGNENSMDGITRDSSKSPPSY